MHLVDPLLFAREKLQAFADSRVIDQVAEVGSRYRRIRSHAPCQCTSPAPASEVVLALSGHCYESRRLRREFRAAQVPVQTNLGETAGFQHGVQFVTRVQMVRKSVAPPRPVDTR